MFLTSKMLIFFRWRGVFPLERRFSVGEAFFRWRGISTRLKIANKFNGYWVTIVAIKSHKNILTIFKYVSVKFSDIFTNVSESKVF